MKIAGTVISILMIVAMANIAYAADLNTSVEGQFRIRAIALSNMEVCSNFQEHANYYDSVVRLKLINSIGENLSGVIKVEAGIMKWGVEGTGGRLGADEKILDLSYAYIEYKTGYGKWDLGIQHINSPKYLVLSTVLPAIVYEVRPIDELEVKAAIMKAYEDESNMDRDVDIYYLQGIYDATQEISAGMYLIFLNNNTDEARMFYSQDRNPIICDGARFLWVGFTSEAEFGVVDMSADLICSLGAIDSVRGFMNDVDAGNSLAPHDSDLFGYAADIRSEIDIDAGVGLKVGNVLAYSSGDDDLTDDKISSFIMIRREWKYFNNIWEDGGFLFVHLDGIADPLGFMGLSLYFSTDPIDRLNMMLNLSNMNYVKADASGNKDIGNEIDLNTVYKLTDNMKLKVELGVLFPGDAFPGKAAQTKDLVTEYLCILDYIF